MYRSILATAECQTQGYILYGKKSDDGLYGLGSFILAENFTSGSKLVVTYVSIGYKASVIVLLHFKHKKIFYNPANS